MVEKMAFSSFKNSRVCLAEEAFFVSQKKTSWDQGCALATPELTYLEGHFKMNMSLLNGQDVPKEGIWIGVVEAFVNYLYTGK